jgi:hypothetical protein
MTLKFEKAVLLFESDLHWFCRCDRSYTIYVKGFNLPLRRKPGQLPEALRNIPVYFAR